MHIRPATIDDIGAIVEMGREFHGTTKYATEFVYDDAHITKTVRWVLENGTVLFAEECGELVGMLGIVVVVQPFSAWPTASEVFWWMSPEARGRGLRLLKAAEAWGREHGAKAMHLNSPSARVNQLYERLGFRTLETVFQKVL